MVVFLDIAAAFDSVKHKALYELLQYIFPNSDFVQCIKDLATGGVCNIFVNGLTGPAFPLTKGTGQGDPLSSLKYVIIHHLAISVLHRALSSRTNMVLSIQPDLGLPPVPIPPLAFADDTAPVIRVTNQRDVDQWNFIWNTLTRVTGLRLNPAKTQILLLGGEQHRSDLTLVQQIGVVSSSVTHLGVIHAADHHESSRLTYDALIPKVEKAVNLFINAASHADLLHRSMLIRSLINSQLLHIFRVYPPSKQQLSKLDSLVRSAMWSKKFEGTPYGRVKVARDRVHAPINKGGLDLALPSVSALHAFYGSLTALLKHAVNSTSSMLNVIHQITAKHANAVNLMGSKSMRSCLPWLSKLIPSSEDSLERLVELLRAIELDPRTAFRASVWGSAYSQFSSISANRFAEKYPQLLSVYQLLNRPQAKKKYSN